MQGRDRLHRRQMNKRYNHASATMLLTKLTANNMFAPLSLDLFPDDHVEDNNRVLDYAQERSRIAMEGTSMHAPVVGILLYLHQHASFFRLFHCVTALITAKQGQEFTSAMEAALLEFDHFDFDLHSRLVECGAALVLTRCLAKSLSQKARLEEIGPICELLTMVFRCYTHVASKSLEDIAGELYPLLLALILLPKAVPTWTPPNSLLHLVERLGCLSIVLHDRNTVCIVMRCFREALVVSRAITDASRDDDCIACFFRLLTGLVHNTDNRRQLVDSSSLLLDRILADPQRIHNTTYMDHLAPFLLVLAQDPYSRFRLAEKRDFVDLTATLLREELLETRKAALALVGMVGADSSGRRMLMSSSCDGLFAALFHLTKNTESRDESMEIIRKLICPDTARLIYENKKLLDTVLYNPTTRSQPCSDDAILVMARLVNRLSNFLLVNGKGMDRLLDAILELSTSTSKHIRYIAAKALKKQAQNEGCSFFLMRTSTVVRTIVALSTDTSPEVRSGAISVVGNLASLPLNQRVLSRNSALLAALSAAASDTTSQTRVDAKREAVNAFLNLAKTPKLKPVIAKQHNVVASLSEYGVLSHDDDKELRNAALHCVMGLAPFM